MSRKLCAFACDPRGKAGRRGAATGTKAMTEGGIALSRHVVRRGRRRCIRARVVPMTLPARCATARVFERDPVRGCHMRVAMAARPGRHPVKGC